MTFVLVNLPKRNKSSRDFTPCETVGCIARANSSQSTGRREAEVRVELAGWPAANLCLRCGRSWEKAWADADGPYLSWLEPVQAAA